MFMQANMPQFMQAASNIVYPAVELIYSVANPTINSISTDGAVTVKSIYNGQPKSVEYPNGLSSATLAIDADANTKIRIVGKLTSVSFAGLSGLDSKPTIIINKKQDKLSYIDCNSCSEITSLDLSGCTALTSLACFQCYELTSLDLSANTALTSLSCNYCRGLTSLDLSANTALTSIDCSNCYELTSLDLSANTALTSLSCNYCSALTSLDLSANTALTSLKCIKCEGLTSLDLSANTALTSFGCSGCSGLTSLDLSANTALTSFSCASCSGLTSLDLSANTALTSIICSNCLGLNSIKYRAINDTPSTNVASAITNATSTSGTVYLNSADPYYSTVANAATAKGWTIASL